MGCVLFVHREQGQGRVSLVGAALRNDYEFLINVGYGSVLETFDEAS